MNTLSTEELKRYARHLVLPEFGKEGQIKLKNSSVLVVGAGGLGSPVLLYLAAAGVGEIGILDFDHIESSNLQRQVLFREQDTGKKKAKVASERIRQLNPHIKVNVHATRLSAQNALNLLSPYDIIVDGTDNFPTRYLVNDACLLLGKPNIYGSIFRFEGQVSVFNQLQEDGSRSPNYRDLFPTPPPPELVPNCAEGGVIGVLPGIIGSLQANEVIKIITGIGKTLAGQLFIMDTTTLLTRKIRFHARNDYEVTQLIDYEQFCDPLHHIAVEEIDVSDLSQKLSVQPQIQLIDVREKNEHETGNLGGQLIPLKRLEDNLHLLDKTNTIVLYCRTGKRSARAAQKLSVHGFDKVYSLKGGLMEWIQKIDSSITLA